MSHNNDNIEREARRHNPALIAIVVALAVAAVVYFVFVLGADEQNEGVATTPPPADATLTEAEGTGGEDAPVIAPDSAAPADGVSPEAETAPAN